MRAPSRVSVIAEHGSVGGAPAPPDATLSGLVPFCGAVTQGSSLASLRSALATLGWRMERCWRSV